ncbi:ATP-dependent RNA helicase Atu1833 [hydrothermal vent metagenome]|uniref:ATP-dependent RNA helicase Atu1833 n=1 Tax=hydrothermal vent metagenome TaxID=652676 RepID=A0A3B0T4E8_9ZZZZ
MIDDFHSLGLSDKVTKAVAAAGYKHPTDIQAKAIPHVLAKRDIIGIAQTGTGKTASFVLPMLTLLEKGRARARMPRTLILEPTRELAAQVFENFEKYGINHRLNVALLIGGVSFVEQNKILDRGADVLIATPGRLLDHFERGRLLMTGTELFVIDEADRMLDMGFIPDIERISSLLPPRRQTLFFSATMPDEIRRLSEKFLKNPEEIQVARQNSTAETIEQIMVKTGGKPAEKRATLRNQIELAKDLKNAIIFCNRKRDIATLTRSLSKHGYNAGSLHGDMDQKNRMATLANFKEGKLKFLIASDVAARGLDIPDVSHVFNFDVPTQAEDYVHRIGRTGRAGRSGTAITLISPAENKYYKAIEQLIGKSIKWYDPNSTEISEQPAPAPQISEQNAPKKNMPQRNVSGEQPTEQKSQQEKPQHSKNPPHLKKQSSGQTDNAETLKNKPAQTPDQNTNQSKKPSPFGDDGAIPAFLLQSMS